MMIGQGWPQEKQYVDLKDRDGSWLAGLVMAKNETLIRVRCEGWAPRYDETIAVSQESILRHAKIQPFRTHTRGYTGQRKTVASREHWKFSTDDHESRIKKLEGFIAVLKEKTAYELWQFLRGEHYFYVDFLMSGSYQSQDDLGKVYHYFKVHIQLCKLYLQKMLESGIQQWLDKDTAVEGGQEETWVRAYRECYFQIFDALYNIAGLNDRLACFLKLNEKNIKHFVGIYQTHENYVSNELLVGGTFEVIKQVIKASYLAAVNESSSGKLPFLFAYTTLQLFLIIEKTLLLEKDAQINQLLEKMFVVISKILNEMDAEHLKGVIIDREIEFLLNSLRLTYIRHNRKEIVCDWIEEFKIKYYVFIIKSNSLDRKLRGILKLKQYCDDIIHYPPNREPKMTKQKFKLLFSALKCQEILFQQSEHSQIFKKSIQLVCFLYKSGMVAIETLIYAWNHSINKEPAVVKHLYNNWNDVALRVYPNDHAKFTEVVANFHTSDSPLKSANESVEFVFRFVECLTKNYNYLKYRNEGPNHINRIQQNITLLIQELYEILLANLSRQNQDTLIEYYSRIVLWSSSLNHFILQLFSNLTHHIYFRISLSILSQIYLQAESNSFFLPQNFSAILLNCLKVSPLNLNETTLLMKLLNRILLASKEFKKAFQMKKDDFKLFWDYFQSVTEDKRAVFYEWITQSRKAEYDDDHLKTYDLFSNELKDYIVMDILCEESFSDLAHLTKKQLEIILQFFIEKNLNQLKLEEKNYFSDYRMVYRLKTIELIKQNFLWTIFEKCKNSDVIHTLNKNLIAFYFFYSPSISYNLKKGRVDQFLIKLKTNLDTGHKDANIGLIKNTLMLLKNVIELIKQDKKLEPAHSLNISCVKAQIYYDGRTYQLEVKYEDTVANIKVRVASFFTLKPLAFKLLNSKQEQMGFDSKDIPICCFSDKYFKVVEIPAEEETLTKFIHTFLNEQIQEILFRMLESEKTALQVYEVLDQLEFKQEKRHIFKRITDILEKHGQIQQANSTSIHCYYLLQMKLINRHMDDRDFIQQCCSYHNFSRFLRMMSYPIKISIHINFLQSISSLLIRMHKKGNFLHKKETSQRCFDVIYELYRYAETRKIQGHAKQQLIKINHSCIALLEQIITHPEMLAFLFSIHHIQSMLQLIFFSNHFEEIKLLFIDRLKKYISTYRTAKRRNQIVQIRMADIFINSFYSKMTHLFQGRKIKIESKSHTQLFSIISKIIQAISPQIPNSSNINSQKILSLFRKIHSFLTKMISQKELRQLQSSRFLITGHLNLLRAIIESHQQLKSCEIIRFVLIQCLGATINVNRTPLCHHPEEIQSAFEVVRAHLRENASIQFIKCIIDLLNPCQRVALWRMNNKWSISVSPEGKQQYSGLINPGCICYMNSLLQQLFMIQQFRSGILAISTQNEQMEEENKNGNERRHFAGYTTILQSLKNLFLNLLFSEENVINPVPFAMTIKTSENRPMIRINEQMDIDEFQSILFDKLQKQLQHLKSRNLIRQLFGGVYSNQIVSAQCPHKSEREQSFISISLQVKKNIYESFKSFVKVDVLDGDNKYFCESCNKKVKAEKIQSIKKLPPYLILCLKRFQFNFQIETKIKINEYCEFYQKIKLKQFSTQELYRNSMTDEQNDTKQAPLPDDYYNYKLRGVVVHTGSADSGHYYSFIENKQGNWFQFNDEDVFPFDIKKLPDEAFGSKGLYDDGRIRNAYLLIYERQAKDNLVEQAQPEQKLYGIQQNKPLVDQILIRNQEIQKFQLVFSEYYSRLIDLMNQAFQMLNKSDANKISQQWQEFLLSYYFLVLIRKENFDRFLQVSEEIEKGIIKNEVMCINYLRLFTSCSFLQQFFIHNPARERCRVISHLFFTALVRYSSDTSEIEFSRNQLLQMIFLSLKIIFINYGQVHELAVTLRKYLQHLAITNPAGLHYIIYYYSFQTVFIDQIFTNVLQPAQRQEYSKYLLSNKQNTNLPILIPIEFTDKKHNVDETLESWRILSLLFREDNKIIKKSLQKQQDAFFKKNFQHLVSIISSISQTKLMNAIYDSHQQSGIDYLYLTFKEIGLLNRLKQAIEKGLKDYQCTKYRPFMLLILAFVNDPSSSDEDFDVLIIALENAYKHNDKYFLEVDLFNQWIVKYASSSDKFLKRLQERKQFIEQILAWISKTPIPNAEHLKKNKLPSNERLLNRYYGIIVSADGKDYENNNQNMKSLYQTMLTSTIPKILPFIRVQQPLKPNKPIKYFDIVLLKWIESTVITNQFGYLTIRVGSKESNHINLWDDSEKIKIPNEDELQEEKSENSSFSYEGSNESEKF